MIGKNVRLFIENNIKGEESEKEFITRLADSNNEEFINCLLQDAVDFMDEEYNQYSFTSVIDYYSNLLHVKPEDFVGVCYSFKRLFADKKSFDFREEVESIIGNRKLSIEEKLEKLREIKAVTNKEKEIKSREVQQLISIIEMKFKTDLYAISRSDLDDETKLDIIRELPTITYRSEELKEKEYKDILNGKSRRVDLDSILMASNDRKLEEALLMSANTFDIVKLTNKPCNYNKEDLSRVAITSRLDEIKNTEQGRYNRA